MTKAIYFGKRERLPKQETKKPAKNKHETTDWDEYNHNVFMQRRASERLDNIYLESMAKLNKNMGEALLRIAKHHVTKKYDGEDY
jgi:hypothetical protein|tara:strand:- start:191 stop:445 length:255 start_codon:yes stop_codon:yes gene_type:complete